MYTKSNGMVLDMYRKHYTHILTEVSMAYYKASPTMNPTKERLWQYSESIYKFETVMLEKV